jgi:hypothetical protein
MLENLSANLAAGRSSHGTLHSKQPGLPISTPPTCSTKAIKDHQPNWSQYKIYVLIVAKMELFLEELDIVDGLDFMHPKASKWIRVSQYVMRASHSPYMQDGPRRSGISYFQITSELQTSMLVQVAMAWTIGSCL